MFIIPAFIIWILALFISVTDFVFIQEFSTPNILINSIGLFLFILGVGIRLLCRKKLASSFTYMLKVTDDQELITDGIYKYIRHPAYSGDLLAQLGLTIFFSSFYGFVLMLMLIFPFLYRIKIEEEMLIERFGDSYIKYQMDTRKLIPFVI